MPKTAIERIMEWLDEQPALITVSMMRKRLNEVKPVEKHIIKQSYLHGFQNYVHPRKHKWTPERFYQERYGPNAPKKWMSAEREKLSKIKKTKSIKNEQRNKMG